MAEWKAVYDKSGGYDCITSAYEIKRDGKTVAEVDRCLFDQVSEWDDNGDKNVEMVEVAEFIVKACNEHDGLVSQLGAIRSAILEKNTDGSLDGLLLLAISKSLESK